MSNNVEPIRDPVVEKILDRGRRRLAFCDSLPESELVELMLKVCDTCLKGQAGRCAPTMTPDRCRAPHAGAVIDEARRAAEAAGEGRS